MELQSNLYTPTFYNSLPSIEAADEAMRRQFKLQTAEIVLAPIFSEHNMSPQWGISLLHRHWWLEPGELPVQDVISNESPKEYQTFPHSLSASGRFWPSLMAISIDSEASLIPLEFSSDEAVMNAHDELHEKTGFIQDLQSTMVKHQLCETFGLIFTRDVDRSAYELVEFNSEKRASILKESTFDDTLGLDTIQTSWRFSLDSEGTKCTSRCWSRCVVPSSGGAHRHEHPKTHAPGA